MARPAATQDLFDALVIGGGPGGAQTALWLSKLGARVCLLEPGPLGGLQARSPYTNSWLSVVDADTPAKAVAARIAQNLSDQSCPIRPERVTALSREEGVFRVDCTSGPLRARHVVLATGTIEVTDGLETMPGAVVGLVQAAELACDGRRVAVLGGGDAACEAYALAIAGGARDVQVFARHVRARPGLWRAIPAASRHVGTYRVAPGAVLRDGERHPYDHLCICYGWRPVLPALSFNPQRTPIGQLVVDRDQMTSIDGLFAVGDVTDIEPPCVANALGAAVRAAQAIMRRLG